MTQPIKRFVDIEVKKDAVSVSGVGFDAAICLTTNATLVTDTATFTTYDAVELYFGASEETDAALAYFKQDTFNTYQPSRLHFAKVGATLDQAAAQATLLAIDNAGIKANSFGMVETLRGHATFPGVMATEIEARTSMLFLGSATAGTLIEGNTANLAYDLKTADRERTAVIYYDDTSLYPEFSWMGQQLPKPVGSTNWAYKTLAGSADGASDIPGVALTEAQRNAALGLNCNLYAETLDNTFTFFGTVASGEKIDIIRNIDFITAELNKRVLSVFLETDIIAMTNAGIATVENRIRSILDVYGVKQGILVDGTVTVTLPKRADISAEDRDARKIPNATFSAELQGAINTITLRGTVYV